MARKQNVEQLLAKALDHALKVQQPLVQSHVNNVRARHPGATPNQIVDVLAQQYLSTITVAGAGVGGAAALPAVTTGPALALSAAEAVWFLEATVLFILAVAEVHGIGVDDVERRKALLLGVLAGDTASSLVEKAAGRAGKYWGMLVGRVIPLDRVRVVNSVLGPWVVRRYGKKQGFLVFGRLAPFGIGALVGGIGNRVIGRGVVDAAVRAFGPAPATFPTPLVIEGAALVDRRPVLER